MKFYYNAKKKSTAAHIWVDGDTACKMLSTGGLRPGIKAVHEKAGGRRVCLMCRNNYRTLTGAVVSEHGLITGSAAAN